MHGHVPPGAAGGGEHHVAAAALEHPRVVMRGQVGVQAAAAGIRHQTSECGSHSNIYLTKLLLHLKHTKGLSPVWDLV